MEFSCLRIAVIVETELNCGTAGVSLMPIAIETPDELAPGNPSTLLDLVDGLSEETRRLDTCPLHRNKVGIGSFSRCSDPHYPDPTVDAVIEAVMRPLGVPFVMGLPFGHGRENFAWPMGVRATLDGANGELRLLEQGVSEA